MQTVSQGRVVEYGHTHAVQRAFELDAFQRRAARKDIISHRRDGSGNCYLFESDAASERVVGKKRERVGQNDAFKRRRRVVGGLKLAVAHDVIVGKLHVFQSGAFKNPRHRALQALRQDKAFNRVADPEHPAAQHCQTVAVGVVLHNVEYF